MQPLMGLQIEIMIIFYIQIFIILMGVSICSKTHVFGNAYILVLSFVKGIVQKYNNKWNNRICNWAARYVEGFRSAMVP